MDLSNYNLTMFGLPLAIALVGDGIDIATRSSLYQKNNKILNEFRNELRKLNRGKQEYGFIIPMYKNPEEVDRCLDNLINNLRVPKSEIITVDDFSNDKGQTKRVAEKYGVEVLNVTKEEKDVRKIRAQRKGTKKWLERGKKYVMCLDSDSYIRTDLDNLELAMAEMDFFNLDAMSGQVLPKIDKDSTLLERIQLLEYKQSMRAGKGSMYSLKKDNDDKVSSLGDLRNKYSLNQASQICISGSFGIFKTSSLNEVLDEMKSYGGGEDTEITLRLLAKKAKIGYNNSIIVETKAPDSILSWFKQRDFWSQFISDYFFDSSYKKGILRKENSKWKPNFDAGGLALRVQMTRDVYIHPIKLVSFPFLVLNPPLLAAFLLTYSGLSWYNQIKTNEKGEKVDLAAGFFLPFYKIGELLAPMTIGYAKQFGRMFRWKKRKVNKRGWRRYA